MKSLQSLLDARARLWEQMKAILQTADAEDRATTVDERQTYDRLDAEVEDLTDQIDRRERHAQREAEMSQVERPANLVDGGHEVVDDEGNTRNDYASAFDLWARFGSGELSNDQRQILRTGAMSTEDLRTLRNAQGVGTQGAGGYTVPPEFRNRLMEAVKWFASVRQVAEVITTESGATLPWPKNDDTANEGAILGENTQVTELDLVFGTASLDVYMYTSLLVRVSLQLLQDSAVNITSFLPRKLGERIGRIQNRHFTLGTGTSQPLGLIPGGTAVQAATGQSTAFTYSTLVDATDRLDPAYLSGGSLAWMGSQAARSAIRKMVDGQQRPLWQPSLQAGTPDLFLGHPWVLNNYMAAPASNAKSLMFGDYREAYIVRDVRAVQTLRLDERFADFLQVAFLAFARSGGTVQNTSAYTVLQNSAA